MRMTSSEVFRPTEGDLIIRDNIAEGAGFEARSRPSTQGGYRFGQLSHNSFFTRHNPHPHRVRHLKGLLDVPICSVNDDGYFASPRYSLQFPPNSFNNNKLNKFKGRIPVNAINVNSQLHPINTITGLQYFMGLNSYPYRERAIPKVGMVPVTEAWRDELQRFTEQLGDINLSKDPAKDCLPKEEERPRTTMYSQETGRLIPPPSRAMSRGNSRRSQRMSGWQYGGGLQHIVQAPDLENVVMAMLCQILQTEDVNAVQSWLCSSGDREKTMVMEMIKAAMAGREEYWKQYPPAVVDVLDPKTKLPPINGAPRPPTGETNRLVLDDTAPVPPVATDLTKPTLRTVVEDQADFAVEPPVNDVFRPPSPPKKPPTQYAVRPPTVPPPMPPNAIAAPRTPAVAANTEEPCEKPPTAGEAKLKYTKTPAVDPGTWNQNDSVNTF